jgi:hypothetical protein
MTKGWDDMKTMPATVWLALLVCLGVPPVAAQAFHAGEYGCALLYYPTPDALKAGGYPDSMSQSIDLLLHDSLDMRLEPAAYADFKAVDDSSRALSRRLATHKTGVMRSDSELSQEQFLNERWILAMHHLWALARLREPIPAPGMDACEVIRDRGTPDRVTRAQTAGGYRSASWWYEEEDHAHLVTLMPDGHGRWRVDTVVW